MKKTITKILLLTLSLSTFSQISLTNYVSSPQKSSTSFVSSINHKSTENNKPCMNLNFIGNDDYKIETY